MFPGAKRMLTLSHKPPGEEPQFELRWYDMEKSEGRLQESLPTKEGQSEDPDGTGDITKYCFGAG